MENLEKNNGKHRGEKGSPDNKPRPENHSNSFPTTKIWIPKQGKKQNPPSAQRRPKPQSQAPQQAAAQGQQPAQRRPRPQSQAPQQAAAQGQQPAQRRPRPQSQAPQQAAAQGQQPAQRRPRSQGQAPQQAAAQGQQPAQRRPRPQSQAPQQAGAQEQKPEQTEVKLRKPAPVQQPAAAEIQKPTEAKVQQTESAENQKPAEAEAQQPEKKEKRGFKKRKIKRTPIQPKDLSHPQDSENPYDPDAKSRAHLAKEPKLNEKIRKKLRKEWKTNRKRVIIVPIVVVSVLFLSVFGVLAYHYLGKVNLGTVRNTHVHEVTHFSITLAWDPVPGAEGYHVFQKKPDSDEYQQISSTENTYDIVYGLKQAECYSFYVKAYSGTNESKSYIPLENIYTQLEKEFINDMYSSESGVIHVGWQPNDKADGYFLEFRTMGKDYREENRIFLDRTDVTEYNITALTPKVSIGVRVSAYYFRDGEKVIGDPSDERSVRVSDGTVGNSARLATEHPMVALSFDDGPLANDASDRILDVLEKYNAKATFFMVGQFVTAFPENVQRKARLGMELGNHTYDHEHYGDEVTAEDISSCSEAIREVTGQAPTAFRSPGGLTTDEILEECSNEGMAAYNWSVDTLDWKTRDPDAIYKEVMDNVQDGDIILMHEIYDTTADAVERIVPELISRGYQIVTCRELVRAKTGADPELYYEYHDLK